MNAATRVITYRMDESKSDSELHPFVKAVAMLIAFTMLEFFAVVGLCLVCAASMTAASLEAPILLVLALAFLAAVLWICFAALCFFLFLHWSNEKGE